MPSAVVPTSTPVLPSPCPAAAGSFLRDHLTAPVVSSRDRTKRSAAVVGSSLEMEPGGVANGLRGRSEAVPGRMWSSRAGREIRNHNNRVSG